MLLLLPAGAGAADAGKAAAREPPAAIVTAPSAGARMQRYPNESLLPLAAGEVLFARDTITGASTEVVVGCNGDRPQRCRIGASGKYEAGGLKQDLTGCTPAVCRLPLLPRTLNAQEQQVKLIAHGQAQKPSPTPGISADTLLGKLQQASDLENARNFGEAERRFAEVAANWSATWLAYHLTEVHALAQATAGGEKSRTATLVIGVSTYLKPAANFSNLHFAHSDALAFADYLNQLGIQAQPLTNDKATASSIREQLAMLEKQAAAGATAVVFISTHGAEQNGNAYVLPYDAFRTAEGASAIGVETILAAMGTGRSYLFVDACRNNAESKFQVSAASQVKRSVDPAKLKDLFAFFAAGPGRPSTEVPNLGHGAFSWALLETLHDTQRRREIDGDALTDGVSERIHGLKLGIRQVPRATGGMHTDQPLTPLMRVPSGSQPPVSWLRPLRLQPVAYQPPHLSAGDLKRLVIRALQWRLAPERISEAVAQSTAATCCLRPDADVEVTAAVRVALEEAGQRILLGYLNGDETPPDQAEFRAAATYYGLAHKLLPDSELLQARAEFNTGRARLFDLITAAEADKPGIFGEAAPHLLAAQQSDPGNGYVMNALGIGYMEMARPAEARAALRDAISEAPEWAYARHNLALTEMRLGRPADAIEQYREAIAHTPDRVYLHFNLGLVYQQTNNLKKAAGEYGEVAKILDARKELAGTNRAMLNNVLGTVAAARGRNSEARQRYRDALAALPGMPEARHNLALLESGERRETLLRDNVDYFESLVALAGTLREEGKIDDAISEYRHVLLVRPGYLAARVEIARLYIARAAGDAQVLARAQQELDLIDAADRENARVWLAKAELAHARGDDADARRDYGAAAKAALAPEDRREVSRSRKEAKVR